VKCTGAVVSLAADVGVTSVALTILALHDIAACRGGDMRLRKLTLWLARREGRGREDSASAAFFRK